MNESDEFGDVPIGGKPGSGNWVPDGSSLDATAVPTPVSRPGMPIQFALAILVWTVLADWLIYRTYGYSGPAAFALLAPLFFCVRHCCMRRLPAEHPRATDSMLPAQAVCVGLLWCAALRLAFAGNGFVVFSAMLLIFAVALASSAVFPWALETIALLFRSVIDGLIWLIGHRIPRIRKAGDLEKKGVENLAWVLPAGAVIVFGSIFVFANPDLYDLVSKQFNLVSTWTWQWVGRLDAWEVPFCVFALVMGAGLLFPHFGKQRIGGTDSADTSTQAVNSPLYLAYRNTLFCLIGLFSIYLVFEFYTLFMQDFPDGFYYAGYAHQGAAWLTVALALATGLLSLIFRGTTNQDLRIEQLKKLAWIWSGTNFLLAIAVYNRLAIYVGYNGLTVMRIVGFFGTTVVVAGFCLVLAKIALRKGFWWLLRTQLTALLLCVIAFTLFPVDYVSHRYNASRINAGYMPPAVMIAVKRKDDSGYIPMLGLVDCPDETIREGVRAMLAERQFQIDMRVESSDWHWTRFQAATRILYRGMAENDSKWKIYSDDPLKRAERINQFEDYAMQWY